MQLPDENVSDMLVELANVAIGPEQCEGCCNKKTKKSNGYNSQRELAA
jgi:hypothetical protein